MTREKIANWFIEWHDDYYDELHSEDDLTPEVAESVLTALRPVSREMVERIWPGCDYCKHAWMEGLDLKPCASGNIGIELTIGRTSKDDAFGILAYYRNAADGYIDFPFCPFCGRPMTDEAVDMVMERLEEMKNG